MALLHTVSESASVTLTEFFSHNEIKGYRTAPAHPCSVAEYFQLSKLYRSSHHFESGFGVFSNRIGALITLGRAWDYTYPQTCNQVQKRGGSGSGRLSINFARRAHRERRAKRVRSVREPHAAEPRRAKRVRPRRAQRARSRIESDERIESGERSESARCASPTRRGERNEPATFCSKPPHAQDQSRRYLRHCLPRASAVASH